MRLVFGVLLATLTHGPAFGSMDRPCNVLSKSEFVDLLVTRAHFALTDPDTLTMETVTLDLRDLNRFCALENDEEGIQVDSTGESNSYEVMATVVANAEQAKQIKGRIEHFAPMIRRDRENTVVIFPDAVVWVIRQ